MSLRQSSGADVLAVALPIRAGSAAGQCTNISHTQLDLHAKRGQMRRDKVRTSEDKAKGGLKAKRGNKTTWDKGGQILVTHS